MVEAGLEHQRTRRGRRPSRSRRAAAARAPARRPRAARRRPRRARRRGRQADGLGRLAVGVEQVVGAPRRRALRRGQAGGAPDQRPRRAADDRQRVGVSLLRHQRAGAAVLGGEAEEAERLARVDLEVLGQAAGGRRRERRVRDELDEPVGLPHRVARVRDHRVEAELARQPLAIGRHARPVDAAGAGRAGVDPGKSRRRRSPSRSAGAANDSSQCPAVVGCATCR